MKLLVGWLGLCLIPVMLPVRCAGQATAGIRGVVRDARGGEALARVEVMVQGTPYRAISDREGRFAFQALQPGDYTLHVSSVGYRLVLTDFHLPAGEIQEFEVALTPDNLGYTASIQVTAGPFGVARADSPSEVSLSGNDAKNLASVLADDPLRAVQALPGITAADDFNSRFFPPRRRLRPHRPLLGRRLAASTVS